MDPNRWKSILVPRWMYEEVVAIALIEGRTISGQLRFMFEEWKSRNLSDPDMIVIRAKVVENRELEASALAAAKGTRDENIESVKIAGIQALAPAKRFGR